MGENMQWLRWQRGTTRVFKLFLVFLVVQLPTKKSHVTGFTTSFIPRRYDQQQRVVTIGRDPFSSTSSLLPSDSLNAFFYMQSCLSSSKDNDDEQVPSQQQQQDADDSTESRRSKIRKRVTTLAKNIVLKPVSYAAPMPQAVAAVLKDATLKAVDMAVEEVLSRRPNWSGGGGRNSASGNGDAEVDVLAMIDEAFLPLEESLKNVEDSLAKAKKSLKEAKAQALDAMEAVQIAAIAQAQGAREAVVVAEQEAGRKVLADIYASAVDSNWTSLAYEDVDYGTSEMAPPFLDEDQCLVPGEPVVRVEKAPENSRRIFAGVDIMASVDDVWKVLTDYAHLQDVVPNLVVNDVLELYSGAKDIKPPPSDLPEEEQCQLLAEQMKGALLRQVGGAKVAGINFSARTTLEVREWPRGLPDFAHFNDEVWEGKSRKQRANDYTKVKLKRYRFPRPFAVSSLPTRDISMQSIAQDDGEFRMYQGVWRMQPLPGCAPEGAAAMRLTYAVEVSPRAYLPVQLVEGRIVRDLCTNLKAIRDFVAQKVPA